ncbi:MAG TPA: hypothetical protein VFE76_16390 [Myxococcales bacterium]|nr:hypothetical protein [Myxococcales bacterium]
MANRAAIAALLAMGLAATLGCKTEKKPAPSTFVLHANGPDWVNIGTGAITDESGKRFQGVGIVSGVRDALVRRRMVDSRARGEIQRTLEEFLETAQKDVPAGTDPNEKQRVQAALKGLASSENGVRVIDHWVDTDNTEYALAELDLASFKSNVEKTKDLDPRAKDAVSRNVDRIFDESSAAKASHSARR